MVKILKGVSAPFLLSNIYSYLGYFTQRIIMKIFNSFMLACMLFFVSGSLFAEPSAGFHIGRGAPPASTPTSSLVMVRVIHAGNPDDVGNDISDHVKSKCAEIDYTQGAAYFDMEAVSSQLKSVHSASAYFLMFECY